MCLDFGSIIPCAGGQMIVDAEGGGTKVVKAPMPP